jgi:hypothetical protein
MLRNFFKSGVRIRLTGGLALTLATNAIPAFGALAADAGMLHLRCTNPVGGANWPVVIDLDHGLVDSLPATITAKWISWSDRGGGVYELERATGKLQLRAASTTGGYFLHYTCQPE